MSSARSSLGSARWPVRVEEHVVERRAPQPDVEQRDPVRRPARAGPRMRTCAPPTTGAGQAPAVLVDLRPRRGANVAQDRLGDRRSARASRRTTSMRSPPTWVLSSSAVPCAIARPWSMTTISSASWSASSRYWVVSSSVVPRGHQLADHVPQVGAAARVQPGGRLVEEQHRGSATRAPARSRRGASRRSSPSPAVAGVVRGRRRSSSSRARGACPRPAEPVQPADHVEVLEAGEVLVDGGVLAGQADAAARLGRVAPARRRRRPSAVPASGLEQGGEDPTRRSSCRRRWAEQPEHRALVRPSGRARRARSTSP